MQRSSYGRSKEKNYKDYLRNEIQKEQRLFLVQSAG